MAFIETLRKAREETNDHLDPWLPKLARLKGLIGSDGIERISTDAVFAFLDLTAQQRRSAGRRLANNMRSLGWVQVRARFLTPRGIYEVARGYARDMKSSRQSGQTSN